MKPNVALSAISAISHSLFVNSFPYRELKSLGEVKSKTMNTNEPLIPIRSAATELSQPADIIRLLAERCRVKVTIRGGIDYIPQASLAELSRMLETSPGQQFVSKLCKPPGRQIF